MARTFLRYVHVGLVVDWGERLLVPGDVCRVSRRNIQQSSVLEIFLTTGDTAFMPETMQTEAPQLPKHKVKYKKAFQRACNEPDAKGKLCGGHLKRWFYLADVLEQACGDVRQTFGDQAEIYRCEHCKTLYLPSRGGAARQECCWLGQAVDFRIDA